MALIRCTNFDQEGEEKPAPEFWPVPRLWAGGTAFIVAGGPSLAGFDGERLRGRRVIAVNNAYGLVPHAGFLYFADRAWWGWHRESAAAFEGAIVTVCHDCAARERRLKLLEVTGTKGLELEKPWGVRTGNNSAYQAINLAVHLCAKRIVLLGVDMRFGAGGRKHWHPGHPRTMDESVFQRMISHFRTLPEGLAKAGVEVVNATPHSALEVFPRLSQREALEL